MSFLEKLLPHRDCTESVKKVGELLTRKADIVLPSAEGSLGYPPDLLSLSKEQLEELLVDTSQNEERQEPIH